MEYQVSMQDVPDQPIVSIRGRLAQSDLPAFIGRSFGELYGHLRLLGVKPGGEPFVIYHEFGPNEVDAEVCTPVAGPMKASGRITSRVLPAATVAQALHIGPYEDLHVAYAAVTHWVGGHGLEAAGPVRERYLDGPGDGVPPWAYRTIVEQPVVEAAVAVS
jgi:effector-binding domain-containing protein